MTTDSCDNNPKDTSLTTFTAENYLKKFTYLGFFFLQNNIFFQSLYGLFLSYLKKIRIKLRKMFFLLMKMLYTERAVQIK